MIGARVTAVLDRLIDMPEPVRREVLEKLPRRDCAFIEERLRYSWRHHARPAQLAPAGSWRRWVVCAGRAWGKTLTAAQWVRERIESGAVRWVTICGPTAATTYRDMLTGPTGLLTISPKWYEPVHEPSKLRLIYPPHPRTGWRPRVAIASADAPERIRGAQHELLWADEPQSWTKPQDAMHMLDLGLRLGESPQCVITLTPKPTDFVRDLVQGAKDENNMRQLPEGTVVTRGTTYENTSLSPAVLEALRREYEGTRLGKQELYAELLDRPERCLFTEETLNASRVRAVPNVRRIVLAVDPSRSRWGAGDLAGGCVAALGDDGDIYVLEDCSIRGTPLEWVKHFASIYNTYRCDGGLFEANRLDPQIVEQIKAETKGQKWEPRTAAESKAVRLEPVAAAAEAGRIHLAGEFPELEEQLVSFDPSEPRGQMDDRLDAFAWACRELLQARMRRPLVVL